MVEETICLQCGDRGYENAFVYCIRCLKFAVHRYCLDVLPETFEEFVSWLCDDCNLKAQNQCAVIKHDAIPFQTKHHEVSKYIEGFSGNGNKENRTAVAEANEHVHEDGSEQTCDACAKSDLVEHGESASQHTSVQLDAKNDGNAILLITDVSKRFQLEEEKVEGNLTEPIQLSDSWPMQKKRKIRIRIKKRQRNIGESTTEKDQERVATASFGECVKVDAKECTRLASDSTLPSKVKQNEFLGQKDQTCLSKPFDQIDDLAIVGVPADHPVISSNDFSRCLKKDGVIKDGNAILLPEDVSKRSQLEEERVERNLIEPIELSVGWLMQKKRKIRIKIKKREISNRESTTEKDQDRLATSFSDEGVKVDIKECTRLASDSALPSKVKENEFLQKDQTCLSKPSFSFTDHVIVDEPADHPVISSNGPSTFLEKDGDDVSKRSQFEEEKVDGLLIEPIELPACCLKQKNKESERNIMESTTEKDQHRLATASHDEHVKVDANKCTRSASDSTLPSQVKENECSEQKDQTCVSKSFDSIFDLGITGVLANHPDISSNGPSVSLRNDGNDIILPADVSLRSQLEEEKIEGNLMDPIDFSAGCLNQKEKKIKRKKKKKRNLMESPSEKDQHTLGTTSYDNCVEEDVNGCTRSACDSTLPSKVKENECSEQRDQTRVSKSYDSITDLCITGVPADHHVIPSNGPSASFDDDGNDILLPEDVSTRSQLEEEKIDGNLIEPIDLSAGCLNQKEKKLKRKKQRKKNIMESTSKKDHCSIL